MLCTDGSKRGTDQPGLFQPRLFVQEDMGPAHGPVPIGFRHFVVRDGRIAIDVDVRLLGSQSGQRLRPVWGAAAVTDEQKLAAVLLRPLQPQWFDVAVHAIESPELLDVVRIHLSRGRDLKHGRPTTGVAGYYQVA